MTRAEKIEGGRNMTKKWEDEIAAQATIARAIGGELSPDNAVKTALKLLNDLNEAIARAEAAEAREAKLREAAQKVCKASFDDHASEISIFFLIDELRRALAGEDAPQPTCPKCGGALVDYPNDPGVMFCQGACNAGGPREDAP